MTGWRILVDLAARRLRVYHDGRTARTFLAVIGKPSTPTPTGQFFVEETIQMPVGHPGGPYALALSARSNVLQEFEGGPAQIAIHGREQLGGTLGAAESHGCLRLATANIDWLATRIDPGTPIRINTDNPHDDCNLDRLTESCSHRTVTGMCVPDLGSRECLI